MQPSTSPVRPTRTVLLAAIFGFVFRGYWIVYSVEDHRNNGDMGPFWDFVHGVGPAPFQYRVGVLRTAGWFYIHLHWPLRYGYTLLDLIGATTALMLGYEMLRRRNLYRNASLPLQWFGSAAYVALVLYLMVWQDFYKKPETDPSAALVMLLLWLWSPLNEGGPFENRPAVSAWLILLLTLVQSLVRADVALCVGLGMFTCALLQQRGRLSLNRTPAIAVAALSAVLAGSTQLVLMLVIYPHARPYESPILMLVRELRHHPQDYINFFAITLAAIWTFLELRRRRFTADAAGLGFAFAVLPYVLLWMLIGLVREVRIFLPLGIAMVPLTVQLLMLRAAGAGGENPPSNPEIPQAAAI